MTQTKDGSGTRKPGTALVPGSYEVGYGKPPRATRFKPGQSGNLNGRKRGSKNKDPLANIHRLKKLIVSEAYRDVDVKDGDKNVTVPMAQAVIRSMAVNAVKGNARSQRLFVELVGTIEQAHFDELRAFNNKRLDYKYDWERELERRRANGIVLPDPFPHPDTYFVDPKTGLVRICGPRERSQIPIYQEGLDESISELEEDLENLKNIRFEIHTPDERKEFRKVIHETEEILKVLRAIARYGKEEGGQK